MNQNEAQLEAQLNDDLKSVAAELGVDSEQLEDRLEMTGIISYPRCCDGVCHVLDL